MIWSGKKFFTLVSCVIFAASAVADNAQRGKLQLEMQQEWALKISSSEIGVLSDRSRVLAVEPPFKEIFLFSRANTDFDHLNMPGQVKMVQKKPASAKVVLKDYSAVLNKTGDTAIVRLSLELKDKNRAANFEYSAFLFPEHLVGNARFKAYYEGLVQEGVVPAKSGSDTLVERFSTLKLDTQYGVITVKRIKGPMLSLTDRRKEGYDMINPLVVGFSLYLTSTPVVESVLEFSFKPHNLSKIPTPLPINGVGTVVSEEISFSDADRSYKGERTLIIPKVFVPGEAAATVFDSGLTLDKKLADDDQRRLETAFWEIQNLPAPVELRLGEAKNNVVTANESFRIDREAKKIVITSPTPRGLFYGLTALRDLDLSRCFVLVDYPDLPIRGQHFHVTGRSGTWQRFLLKECWSRARINYVGIDVANVRWESSKNTWESAPENFMSKEELKEFIDLCRDRYIEVVPSLQLFSHVDWFFRNNANAELRENPNSKYPNYNYNWGKPETRKIIYEILDEIIETFGDVHYFNACHDEVDNAGLVTLPGAPENKHLTLPEYYMRSINDLHAFFKKRGIKMMIWHDGLMSAHETSSGHGLHLDLKGIRAFRKQFPRDIILLLWSYSEGQDFREFEMMKREGFTVIGCPWYLHGNVSNMAIAAKRAGIPGIWGTTWYNVEDGIILQLGAQIKTAAYCWCKQNDAKVPPRRFEDLVADLFASMKSKEIPPAQGITFDLSAIANYLPGTPDGLLNVNLLKKFVPGEKIKVGRGEFIIPKRNGKLAAVLLRSFPEAGRFPESVTLPLNGKFSNIHLLGTSFGVAQPAIATLMLKLVWRYSDGSSITKKIHSSDIGHIRGWSSIERNFTNCIEFDNGRIWASSFKNPAPEKECASIQIVSVGTPYMLFGAALENFSE